MKTPEEILNDLWLLNGKPVVRDIPPDNWREIALMAMKEFGQQAWLGSWHSDDDSYGDWLQSLYLNQIAKESQDRGEYEGKPEECKHERSYHFHINGRRYCPNCKKYID